MPSSRSNDKRIINKKYFLILFFLFILFIPISKNVFGSKGKHKIVHLTVWKLPRPEDTSIEAKCFRAIIRAFLKKYPYIKLSSPTGIVIPEMSGMDTKPLMAIAGGVSPDVIYVNFRQSNTYIKEGFLYPLDKWVKKLPPEELKERVLPQVKKVIYRWGPGKKTGEDPNKHWWALPYRVLVKGLAWRKDLFQAVGLDPDRPPRNWKEYYEFAKKCTDPDKGTYGILWGKGPHWSWCFYSILCSAGAKAMEEIGEDEWRASFNSPEAVSAYEFIIKLVQGKWRHPSGKIVEGVVYREEKGGIMWEQGRIGMMEMYFSEEFLANINPELIGIAPVPAGPGGKRASELNCAMCGIFSGAAKKGPEVLEAAWKYIYFLGSTEAKMIRTKVLVKNGYGIFANPKYLKKLGYTEYLRRIPKSWRKAYEEAIKNGEPEPYGKNCQMIYNYMSLPADKMLLEGLGYKVFDAIEEAKRRLKNQPSKIIRKKLDIIKKEKEKEVRRRIKEILDKYVKRANEKMIGEIPPKEMKKRRTIALIVALIILMSFTALFLYIKRIFTPPEAKGSWMFKKYWFAYLLLIPAVGGILLWQYVPMIRGALMAFQDYHIILKSRWVGLDNFANVLWDPEFWRDLKNSLWYVTLSILMGFFAPIILAILLHEVPKGKILFRTIYYLPAVISGLVVMLMWKNFYEPSANGLLNQLITGIRKWMIDVVGILGIIGLSFGSFISFKKRSFTSGIILTLLNLLVICSLFLIHRYVSFPLPPQRWLEDPKWAMVCVVLPTVWAGIGPGCLIYLAALKTIPEDLYEAADLDGAGFFEKIWYITIPTIKVLIVINFIGAVVNAFRVAGYILAMTGGGPAGATEVLALKIFFDAFVYLRFGFATATAWILGTLLIGFTVFQLRRLSKVEFKTAGG